MPFTLTHTRLLVQNFPACFRFYRDILGLAVTYGAENEDYADLSSGSATLALFKRELMAASVVTGATASAASGDSQDRVALIFAVENVDEKFRDLKSRGVAFITEPQDRPDWGIRTAHLRDPDGNLIELYASLSR